MGALTTGRYTFLETWDPGIEAEENAALRRRALTSDVFVTCTSALTMSGKILNMDGHGNRLTAILFGPALVNIVVGINRTVPGVEAALDGIRKVAAPLNVRRHPDWDPVPPFGETGTCSDCRSAWRICDKTVIMERQDDNDKYGPTIKVVIAGERLGL